MNSKVIDMTEKTFYQDADALVSNARVVMGSKTYALRNITSVNTREIPPNNTLGALLLIIGLFLGVIHVGVVSSSVGATVDPGIIVTSLLMIGAGAYQFFTAKTTHLLLFSTSGNEVQAMASQDKKRIDKISNAVNEAIIHQA